MDRGCIHLYRSFADNAVWTEEKFSKGQALIDLCLKASEKEKTVCIRGRCIDLNLGQLAWSELIMAQRWGWSRNKTRAFLARLEREGWIKQRKDRGIKVITIRGCESYQDELENE